MSQVQAAYTELLAAGNAGPAPEQLMTLRARAPLTLDQLIEQLTQLRARHPEYGPRPVHLLNITNDGDGLVTTSTGTASIRCRPGDLAAAGVHAAQLGSLFG